MKNIFKNKRIQMILFLFAVFTVGGLGGIVADNLFIEARQVGYNNVKSETNSQDVQAAIDELYARTTRNLLDKIYPKGSVYITFENINPSTIFGGTWVRCSEGTVIVGAKDNDKDFAFGNSGGVREVALTLEQIPKHSHHIPVSIGVSGSDSIITFGVTSSTGGLYTDFNGGDANGNTVAHNNLQPYITAYIWKRTA